MTNTDSIPQGLTRRPSRSAATTTFSTEVFDNEVVPSSLSSIAPILRIAKEIEHERPRVAYLCRFYAFEKAHRLDQNSTGRGVRQFKTGLLQRLERDNASSLASRVKKTDAREIGSYYQQYYEHYVRALDQGDQADRAQLSKAYQTAGVLFEVLCAVNKTEKVEEVAPEIIAAAKDVQEKKDIYIPYNILPLDAAGASQSIMQLEEVKAAVAALWNIRGLNWPSAFEPHRQKTGDLDLLDWLRAMFGFQRDNVRNMREHLILLLANNHIRLHPKPEPLNKLDERAVDAVMSKLFKNYKTWCKFLGRKHSLRLPQGSQEIQQRKILYMGLYLLIWGEAANVRFMPECLCYIFHNMAYELHGLLAENVSIVTGENIKPSYGGDDEAFLRKVITPLYCVIQKEAEKSQNGKASHSFWCNYDDLNEYFWCSDCFSLGWPMRDDGDFFKSTHDMGKKTSRRKSGSTGKSNFVEIRSFWHLFRSFDRLWTFYILALQVLVILAWSGVSLKDIFRKDILYYLSSIFITAAVLRFLQSVLDLVLNFPGYHRWKFTDVIRNILKIIVSLAWVIILPLFYVRAFSFAPEQLKNVLSFLHQVKGISPLYIMAVVLYLLPNLLAAALFIFPMLRRWIENSDWHIIRLLLWWSQVLNRTIRIIIKEIESNISKNTLLANFRMASLPVLCKKFVELVGILKDRDPSKQDTVVFLLQDMLEVVTRDMMVNEIRELVELGHSNKESGRQLFAGTGEKPAIMFPPVLTAHWEEQIRRLHILLTVKESAIDIPTNLEARRRIAFFANSLFMDMPRAPRVRNMLSFSVLTPYYSEETVYSKTELEMENEDGVSIIFYLQKIFPDEWNNFIERLNCKETEILENDENILQLRHWVSLRGQTLCRTVRGMMYYRRALRVQAFLDMATENEILEGYKAILTPSDEDKKSQRSLYAQLEAVADLKFTYVATCQNYGNHKRSGDRRATDILNLMVNNPSLRVAYIDEVEEREGGAQKVYYSVLVKGVDNLDQDNYLEEAFKMRNLLEEFNEDHGVRPPTILGVREHIFTGSVSSLAWFMSNQETSFVTIGQRVLARPLKVRFHYGHPDVFDRIFHITRGGISKGSRGINLSEDIFAGFNSTLRRGNITHHEYIQVGKGRDVGFNQISLFESKVACGNGEQTLSRDIYRLGHRFDFFRMLSCYFTTVGYYISSMLVVFTVYLFLYGRLYLSLSGLEESIVKFASSKGDDPLKAAMASQSVVQLGLLTALPMVMEIGLERGFRTAFGDIIIMQLQLAAVFFTFSLGTRVHYFGRTILHGGAKYRATGRGFVVRHEKFAENYRMYSRSHFVKGLEILVLLICYRIYGSAARENISYVLLSFSMWFLVLSWLFAPFLLNPSGFEWQKIVEDWEDWAKWINSRGGIGVPSIKSWESWWDEEQEHLQHTGFMGRLAEIVLALRFFLYQYGIVYQLNMTKKSRQGIRQSIMVYGLSWLVIVAVMIVLKIVSVGRKKFSADFQLMFRLLKLFLFAGCIVIIAMLFYFLDLTVGDIFQSLLAFMPTGWAILQISQACRPFMRGIGMWSSVKALARGYEYMMGVLIFAPIAILAWFPFVSEFQTRLLFNQAFSRGLQIQRILAGSKKQS
ncbi:hypothetical protein CRYUN_Cryun22dG0054300 [Craigia yunnanensis]